MDIKQEDLIKFWTWCGIERKVFPVNFGKVSYGRGGWYLGEHYLWQDKPSITLDRLYTYAIPKLQDKGWDVCLYAVKEKRFKVSIERRSTLAIKTESDNPTEALYKAIMVVIDKEIK